MNPRLGYEEMEACGVPGDQLGAVTLPAGGGTPDCCGNGLVLC